MLHCSATSRCGRSYKYLKHASKLDPEGRGGLQTGKSLFSFRFLSIVLIQLRGKDGDMLVLLACCLWMIISSCSHVAAAW
jgi:hypothetical protein